MSYHARGPGASKATASTLCQKCLQRGHYSYECKVGVQERPYVSRPSRSQQFLNPKLRPALTNDAPTMIENKKGTADQILTRNADERRRKREFDAMDEDQPRRKRSRSMSSSSFSSVETISTRASCSPSPRRRVRPVGGAAEEGSKGQPVGEQHGEHRNGKSQHGAKRRRRTSSISEGGMAAQIDVDAGDARNTRRRKRSSSPAERGRRQHRSHEKDRPYLSPSKDDSHPGRKLDRPHFRGRRDPMDKGELGNRGRDAGHYRGDTAESRRNRDQGPHDPAQFRRDRSLSPYSKRLAMSRGVQAGG